MDSKMTREQIERKLEDLKSLKLPQLNKKSRAHQDWKREMENLTRLLDTEMGKLNKLLKRSI
jgi:hypothetical protein